MIILTPEIFVNLKKIQNFNVGCNVGPNDTLSWFVHMQGILQEASSGYDGFDTHIACASKEMAYKLFNDILLQVMEQGDIVELTNELVNRIILYKEKQ